MLLSPRRAAQFGLASMVLVLVVSLGVLVARTLDQDLMGVQIGQAIPELQLQDTAGKTLALSSICKHVAVLFFASPRSALSNVYTQRVVDFAKRYASDGRVDVVAINSIHPNTTELDEVRVQAGLLGEEFPTLVDSTGQAAKLFGVHALPTFCVIDTQGVLRYTGAFDNSQEADGVTSHYCEDAVRALLSQQPVTIASSGLPDPTARATK